jgi:hypothetical protein
MTTPGEPAGLARPTPEEAQPTVAPQDDNRADELEETEESSGGTSDDLDSGADPE